MRRTLSRTFPKIKNLLHLLRFLHRLPIKIRRFIKYQRKRPLRQIVMKIPRSKLRGIFVGEEIYYTGGDHTHLQFLDILVKCYNINRNKQQGMDPRLPIKAAFQIIVFGGKVTDALIWYIACFYGLYSVRVDEPVGVHLGVEVDFSVGEIAGE